MANKSKKILSALLALATVAPPAAVMAKGTEYVSVTGSLLKQGFANSGRAYCVGGGSGILDASGTTAGGVSGTQYWNINSEEFIKNSNWVYEWEDLEAVKAENNVYYKTNQLELNGIKYAVDVIWKDEACTTLQTSGVNTKTYYNLRSGSVGDDSNNYLQTLDIEDGYYAGVSFLGSVEVNNYYMRYVYEDDTTSPWIQLTTKAASLKDRIDGNSIETVGNTWFKTKDSDTEDMNRALPIYLHAFTDTSADMSKKVTKIQFPARNAVVTAGSYDNPTKGTNNWNYRSCFVGITLLTTKEIQNGIYVEALKSVWSKKPADFSGTADEMKWLASLEEAYTAVDKSLISDEDDKALLSAVKEFMNGVEITVNSKKIDELKEIIDELPELDDMTISSDNEKILERMKEKYKQIDVKLDYDAEHKAVLASYSAYIAKYEELLITENDAKIAEIKKITDELPLLSEFDKVETFTDEVIEKLRTIKEKLEKVNTDLKITDTEAYDTAKAYAAHIDTVYKLENKENIAVIAEFIKDLPAADKIEKTIENERIIVKIQAAYNKLYVDYLSTDEKKTADSAKAYIAVLDKFEPVSVTVSPDVFVNMDTTYRSGSSGLANESDGNYFLDGEKFMKMDIWKEPWNVSNHMAENTLMFNGIAYKVRVAEGDYSIMSAFCANADTKVGYDVIDINDGFYTGISFLGTTNTNGTKAGVCFNYEDGTSSIWQSQALGRIYTQSDAALQVPAGKYSSANGNIYGKTAYIYQLTFNNPNPNKKVVSISIPYRNVTINGDGSLTINPTSGGTAYAYWGRWLGITMLQRATDFEDKISSEFAKLENISENEMKSAVTELDKLVTNAEIMGMDVTEIDGYSIYERKGSEYVRIKEYSHKCDLTSATLNIIFAANVEISKNDVKLTDSDGNAVEFDFESNGNTAKITYENNLDAEKEYILKLSGNIAAENGGNLLGSAIEYKFTTPECAGFESFTSTEKSGKLQVSFEFKNNHLAKTDALIIVCVMNKNGEIHDSFAAKGKDMLAGNKITVTNKELSICDGYAIKVFCWDNIGGLNTICKY